MKSDRCEWMVTARAYSMPGRCEIRNNVKPVVVAEGKDKILAKLCVRHRSMIGGKRPLSLAR